MQSSIEKEPLPAGLYIIATPIGHPDDISLRALRTLKEVEVVACEDTRVTNRLLTYHGLKKSMICYNDFSTEKDRNQLLSRIKRGERVALVSDAGTPLISDPGYKLVLAAYEEGYPVVTLPGPSSVIAALTLAGLPTNRFLFEGFLPTKVAARKAALEALKGVDATLIFFESPKRLTESLEEMLHSFGNRQAAVVRELTKTYEEVRKNRLVDLLASYQKQEEVRGEIIVLVGPPEASMMTDEEVIKTQLRTLLTSMRVKEAVAVVAEHTHLPKKQIYHYALSMMKEEEE